MTAKCKKLAARFQGHHHPGKQAREAVDRPRLVIDSSCSVALEKWGLSNGHTRTKLWDYFVVTGERLLGVEVHPATAGDVKDVLDKHAWALARLREADTAAQQWWWIPSGRNTVPSSGRATRLLAKAGIRLSRRVLDARQVEDADR